MTSRKHILFSGTPEEAPLFKWRSYATDFLNAVKNFFGSTATSRMRSLKRVHPEGERFFRIKNIIPIRWTSSEASAVENFLKMYPTLWETMSNMAQSFDESKTKAKQDEGAGAMVYAMSDVRFYMYLVFELQLLEYISSLSKELQKVNHNAVMASSIVKDLGTDLEKLLDTPWECPVIKKYMTYLRFRHSYDVGNSRPLQAETIKKLFEGYTENESFSYSLSITDIEDPDRTLPFRDAKPVQGSREPRWRSNSENVLKASNANPYEATMEHLQNMKQLSTVLQYDNAKFDFFNRQKRQELLQSFLSEMERRFDLTDTILNDLQYISPSRILDVEKLSNAKDQEGRRRIFTFRQETPEEATDLEKYFSQMVRSLARLEDKDDLFMNEKNPDIFYPFLLERQDLIIHEKLRAVLNMIQAIPSSTAEVERGFSVLFNILEGKSTLTTTNLGNRLRISLNGPDVKDFDPEPVTNVWMQNHRTVEDCTAVRGKAQKEMTDEELRKEEYEERIANLNSRPRNELYGPLN